MNKEFVGTMQQTVWSTLDYMEDGFPASCFADNDVLFAVGLYETCYMKHYVDHDYWGQFIKGPNE